MRLKKTMPVLKFPSREQRQRAKQMKQVEKNKRHDYDEGDAVQKTLDELNNSIENLQFDMVNFTNEGNAWLDAQGDEQQRSMSRMNRVYQRRLLMMCVSPLQDGITPGSLLTAASMFIGLSLGNPDMLKTMKTSVGTVLNTAASEIESRGGKLGDSGISKFLRKHGDKYLRSANNGRLPFTAETAALAHMALTREAYVEMRDGKHVPEDVKLKYEAAENTLHTLMAQDEVSMEDMRAYEKNFIGRMAMKDIGVAQRYNEISYDGVAPAKAKKVRETVYVKDEDGNLKPEGYYHEVWNGEFVDAKGKNYTGNMSLREPMSEDELANRIGVDMVHNFAHRCANELDGIGETSKTTYSSMLNALSDSCGLDCGVEVKNPTELYDTEYNKYKQLFDCGKADGMSGNQMFRTAVLGGATTELAVATKLIGANYMMSDKEAAAEPEPPEGKGRKSEIGMFFSHSAMVLARELCDYEPEDVEKAGGYALLSQTLTHDAESYFGFDIQNSNIPADTEGILKVTHSAAAMCRKAGMSKAEIEHKILDVQKAMLGAQYEAYEYEGENREFINDIAARDGLAFQESGNIFKRLVDVEKIKTFSYDVEPKDAHIVKADDKAIEKRANDDYNKRVQSTFDKFASVFGNHDDTEYFER